MLSKHKEVLEMKHQKILKMKEINNEIKVKI